MGRFLDPLPMHQTFTLSREEFEVFMTAICATDADSVFDVDFSVLTDTQVKRVLDVLFTNHIKKESKKK